MHTPSPTHKLECPLRMCVQNMHAHSLRQEADYMLNIAQLVFKPAITFFFTTWRQRNIVTSSLI